MSRLTPALTATSVDGTDRAAGEARVVADDRVLHDVGEQEDDHEVERVEARRGRACPTSRNRITIVA